MPTGSRKSISPEERNVFNSSGLFVSSRLSGACLRGLVEQSQKKVLKNTQEVVFLNSSTAVDKTPTPYSRIVYRPYNKLKGARFIHALLILIMERVNSGFDSLMVFAYDFHFIHPITCFIHLPLFCLDVTNNDCIFAPTKSFQI